MKLAMAQLQNINIEIEALKGLVHHNVASLFHVIETPNKVFVFCGVYFTQK
jgi:hypothetical protein